MAVIQTQRHCKACARRTLHSRSTFSSGWGIFLSLITMGLFVPVWLLIGLWDALTGKWRCQACGQGRML